MTPGGQVWVPIPGPCRTNPYDSCREVSKSKEGQVVESQCRDLPQQHCSQVPRQQCQAVPDQVRVS